MTKQGKSVSLAPGRVSLMYAPLNKQAKWYAAIWVTIPRNATDEDYSANQWGLAGHVENNFPAQIFTPYDHDVVHGVPFHWGLAGAGGAYFHLFWLPGHTAEQVQQCKAQLKRDRDVVSMDVIRVARMVKDWEPVGAFVRCEMPEFIQLEGQGDGSQD